MRRAAIAISLLFPLSSFAAEPAAGSDPLAGTWKGVRVFDTHTAQLSLTIRKTGTVYVGSALEWKGLTESQAVAAAKGQKPPVQAGAYCLNRPFAVRLQGDEAVFTPQAGQPLFGPPREMDPFTVKLVAGGFLVANPAPVRQSGGVVRLWREGALDTPLPLELEKGKTHALECLDGGGYRYSCLLPTTYDPAKPTPVLVNFDPGGNARPLRPEIADELGWIQVGLTESRNGPTWVTHENRDTVIFDLRRRFNVDPRRIYCSGFSGGARAASLTAQFYPGMVAGLVLAGAAHTRYPPQKEIPVVYIVGESDMNRKEVEAAFAEDRKVGRASELFLHPGGHAWGRKEDHEKALRWLAKEASPPGGTEKK